MCSVLLVDDDAAIRDVMTQWTHRLGHDVRQAATADEAIQQMAELPAGVAVCDVRLPGHDGVWLASRLRDLYPDTAIIMATGSQDADVALSSLRIGAVDFLSKPFTSEQFRHALARGVRWNRDAEQARQRLEMLNREVVEQLGQIEAFFTATPMVSDADLDRLIERIMPDQATLDHVRRVAALATNMAVYLGIRSPELADIGRAALLHDLGRVVTPVTILCKPARLSEEEITVVRQQPRLVSEILARNELLAPAAVMVRAIFEHTDGTGYPFALRGEEIPRGARIIAVADALDAMTHHRMYRDTRTPAEALFEIKRGSGTQFDPWAVDALLSIVHLHWASVLRRPRDDGDSADPSGTAVASLFGPAHRGPADGSTDSAAEYVIGDSASPESVGPGRSAGRVS